MQEDFPSGLRSLRLHGGSRRNSLLRWCQCRTQGYKNIEITNFSSCWVDGLAFCAIYHSYLPSHIPYNRLSPENKKENLTLAFQTGEGFGISTSLTVEEMLKDDAPDWHRVLEYVESIYRHFEMWDSGDLHIWIIYDDHEWLWPWEAYLLEKDQILNYSEDSIVKSWLAWHANCAIYSDFLQATNELLVSLYYIEVHLKVD